MENFFFGALGPHLHRFFGLFLKQPSFIHNLPFDALFFFIFAESLDEHMEKISAKGFLKLSLFSWDTVAGRQFSINDTRRSQNAWVFRLSLLQIRILRKKLCYFKKKVPQSEQRFRSYSILKISTNTFSIAIPYERKNWGKWRKYPKFWQNLKPTFFYELDDFKSFIFFVYDVPLNLHVYRPTPGRLMVIISPSIARVGGGILASWMAHYLKKTL